MKSLSSSDGYESSTISDDPTRITRLNPANLEIINRVLDVQKHFRDYKPPAEIELNPDGSPKGGSEKSGTHIGEFIAEMRKAFNGTFLSDVYDTISAGQLPLCTIDQKHLYEGVLDSPFVPVKPTVKTYNRESQEKMNRYPEDIKQ